MLHPQFDLAFGEFSCNTDSRVIAHIWNAGQRHSEMRLRLI
jgi:hypothetical protein